MTSSGNQFNVRAVERGSRLVIAHGPQVVLQMPRGNLEGIQPRLIMLKRTVGLIKHAEYGKAFRLLRQHKLDINMLHDVDPEQFFAKIDKFVAEIQQVDYMNLFVNSLDEKERGPELEFLFPISKDELIKREHAEMMKQFSEEKKVDLKEEGPVFTKVNKICDALRAELERVNRDNFYLLPILTTYIKK